MKYDLVIIGGGAAGMLAAISARIHHSDWKIIIIEKNASLGRKILVTGNGRCNLTNVNLEVNGENHYNDPSFVKSVFSQFSYGEIMKFFNELGLRTYEEKKNNTGKIFPVSDQASSIIELLVDALISNKIEIKKETNCQSLKKQGQQFIISLKSSEKSEEIIANKVIITAGGKTYPALGADGNGFELVRKLGHTIILPIPSGVPLEGKNQLAQELQGLKLSAEINLPEEKKSFLGDLMFTKYGLSGTAILLCSRPLSLKLNGAKKREIQIELNFMPGYNFDSALSFWQERKEKFPNRLIEIDWTGVYPPKFAKVFLKLTGLSEKKYKLITEAELKKTIKLLISYPWKITATRGWNEAEFTAGGVDVKEINQKTLESKIISGLYFAGEVIDIDGEIGGYNLSWAWASGFVAGCAN